MERFWAEALVLGTVDYGDADRIVTLLTRERGRVAAFASGARKSAKRFSGALEPFTRLRAALVERRGDTYRLDQVDLLDPHGGIRGDLERIARAGYASELCRELCRDHLAHEDLYELLLGYLQALARGQGGGDELMSFELGALARGGLMPRLDRCSRCGRPPGQGDRFASEHGGLLCAACDRGAPAPEAGEGARALLALQRGEAPSLAPRERSLARALLNQFIAHHLGRRLKSLEFMAQVGLSP